ncbi:MAG: hypothetical protein ACFB6S_01485 [Geminicoccaceae bacterium]
MTDQTAPRGMTRAQAKTIEWAIILLCVASLVMIFQPFSIQLFSIGCVTVVIGGLTFNLVPFCREGVPFRVLGRVLMIVAIVLICAVLLGVVAAYAYVAYLGTLR